MLTLGNIFVLLLLATAGAWLWHAHGVRERALERVKRHCAKVQVELLDENVALRTLTLLRDARGRKRLARVYGFEFTVTGEQRHVGSIVMFGQQCGPIELAPHPFPQRASEADIPVVTVNPGQPAEPAQSVNPADPRAPLTSAKVIELQQWRREHPPRQD
jgi:hypothetical protein